MFGGPGNRKHPVSPGGEGSVPIIGQQETYGQSPPYYQTVPLGRDAVAVLFVGRPDGTVQVHPVFPERAMSPVQPRAWQMMRTAMTALQTPELAKRAEELFRVEYERQQQLAARPVELTPEQQAALRSEAERIVAAAGVQGEVEIVGVKREETPPDGTPDGGAG